MEDSYAPLESRSLVEADLVAAKFAEKHGLRLCKPTYCLSRLRGPRHCPQHRDDFEHFHAPEAGMPGVRMFALDGRVVLATIEVFLERAAVMGLTEVTTDSPHGVYSRVYAIVAELKAEGFEVTTNAFMGQVLEPFQGGDAVMICVSMPGMFS